MGCSRRRTSWGSVAGSRHARPRAQCGPMTAPLSMLIVGAGFGGIGAAIHRRRCGDDNFLLIEQAGGVGGTWWANRYPGAACDIPSHLYSFSFAPNPHWSRKYPAQPEIEAYLNDCVQRFGLVPRLRLHTRLSHLHWDEAQHLWRARLLDAAGHEHELLARTVTLATGPLSRPATPPLFGLERFQGPVIHTARWPQRVRRQWPPRRRGGHRRQRDPAGAAAGAASAAAHRCFSARRRGCCRAATRRSGRPRAGCSSTWRQLRRAWRAAIYARHELRAPAFTRQPTLAADAGAAGDPAPEGARAARRAARRADAGLPHGLQTHPDCRRLLPHAVRAARAARDHGHLRGRAPRRAAGRRAPRRPRRADHRHRLRGR